MATYEVYASVNHRDVEFVRDKASILALALPGLWLLWNRLWFEFAVYLVISFFLIALGNVIGNGSGNALWAQTITLISLVPGIFVYLEGTSWIASRKIRRGLSIVELVDAETLEAAELKYFSKTSGLAGENKSQDFAPENLSPTTGASGVFRVSGHDKPEFGLFAEE